jgi:hypothetical protein
MICSWMCMWTITTSSGQAHLQGADSFQPRPGGLRIMFMTRRTPPALQTITLPPSFRMERRLMDRHVRRAVSL